LLYIALALFGAALIAGGIVAIVRRRTRASGDGEPLHEYAGAGAVLLGVVWIVLGAGVIVFALDAGDSGLMRVLATLGGALVGR
jgi:hypothetical protein